MTFLKNDQSCADLTNIVSIYEELVVCVCQESGVPADGMSFHIEGDQLTRERFPRA